MYVYVCVCVFGYPHPLLQVWQKNQQKKHKILIINKRVKAKADMKEAATLGRPGLSC